MTMPPDSNPPTLAASRALALQSAMDALQRARKRRTRAVPHRAIARLTVTPTALLQALLLPLVFCSALVWGKTYVMQFWYACIRFWSLRLDLPMYLAASVQDNEVALSKGLLESSSSMPSPAVWSTTLALTVLAYAGSYFLRGPRLPLKYLLRIMCTVQALALGFFWFAPSQFPYTIADHILDMVDIGYLLMLAVPAMLAIGYYVLRARLLVKIAHTLGILVFFLIMVPHQVVLHTMLLRWFSLLYMPLLYLCFGMIFDMLVFVALYSWAASTLPPQNSD